MHYLVVDWFRAKVSNKVRYLCWVQNFYTSCADSSFILQNWMIGMRLDIATFDIYPFNLPTHLSCGSIHAPCWLNSCRYNSFHWQAQWMSPTIFEPIFYEHMYWGLCLSPWDRSDMNLNLNPKGFCYSPNNELYTQQSYYDMLLPVYQNPLGLIWSYLQLHNYRPSTGSQGL